MFETQVARDPACVRPAARRRRPGLLRPVRPVQLGDGRDHGLPRHGLLAPRVGRSAQAARRGERLAGHAGVRLAGGVGQAQPPLRADRRADPHASQGLLLRRPGAGRRAAPHARHACTRTPRCTRPTAPPKRCRSSTIEAREVLGETAAKTAEGAGVCVGRKFDSIEWRVIRITDEPIATIDDAEELPPGEIGELIVRGPQVSPAYIPVASPRAEGWEGVKRPVRTPPNPPLREGPSRSTPTRSPKSPTAPPSGIAWATSATSTTRAASGTAAASRSAWRRRRAAVHRARRGDLQSRIPRCDAARSWAMGPRGDADAGRDRRIVDARLACVDDRSLDVELVAWTELAQELAALAAAQSRCVGRSSAFLLHPQLPVDVRHNAKINREAARGVGDDAIALEVATPGSRTCTPVSAHQSPVTDTTAMHALVTGGGGFLGRYIVEQLVARGDRVRSFGRGAYPELEALGVEVVRGDVADRRALSTPRARASIACSMPPRCAGIGVDWRPYERVNVRGTEHVIAAAASTACRGWSTPAAPASSFAGEDQCGVDESAPLRLRLDEAPRAPTTRCSKALAEQAVLAANDDRAAHVRLAPAPHLGAAGRSPHPAADRPRPLAAGCAAWATARTSSTSAMSKMQRPRTCGGRRAGRARLARRRQGVLHQPGRAGELLAVDRRSSRAGRPAAGAEVDFVQGGLAPGRRLRSGLPHAAPARRAADDAVPRRPTGQVALVRHLRRPPRFRLRAASFHRRRHATPRRVAPQLA